MRLFGPEHPVAKQFLQAPGIAHRRVGHHAEVAVLEVDVDYTRERRVTVESTLFNLMGIEALVVVLAQEVDYGMVGACGLHDNTSRDVVATSGTSGYLLKHVERPFGRAEVGEVDESVGVEHAYEAHSGKVEPLCHHLCPDKYLCLSGRKVGYYFVVSVFVARGVEVHAQHLGVAECSVGDILKAFGSVAEHLYGRFFARRTYGRQLVCGPAVVAHHLVLTPVVGERYIAVLAFGHVGTLLAHHYRSKSASVVE